MTKYKQFKQRIMDGFCCFLTVISPTFNTKVRYFMVHKKALNLSVPQTLDEKILWLKLNRYMKDPLVIQCADKYRVREYIKACGCEDILVELLGVYDCVDDINWEALPDQFVLKWNFGAGFNLICTDKSKLDKENTLKTMRKWGKEKYWLSHSEMQYKYIPKKIVCEKLLNSDTVKTPSGWKAPYDYKIFCFNGKAKYIMVMVGREKGFPTLYVFDERWSLVQCGKNNDIPPESITVKKPVCFEKMLEIAEKIAQPFPFVRCDLYAVEEKVYFGEMTFTPSGGMYIPVMPEVSKMMGEAIDLGI